MKKILLFTAAFASLVSAQNIIQLPDSIRASTDTVVWVKRIPMYCEGPVWEPSTGYVYFTEQFAASVANWPLWRVKPGVDTGVVFVNTYQNNGLDFDPQGRLVSCQNGRLSRYKSDGTLDSTLVASPSNNVTFNQANDVSIGANGAMYFTALGNAVYYLSPTRVLTTATNTTATVAQANGIEWLEDENAVYVNETGNNRVRKLPITSPGVLGAPTTFASSPGPDGGTYDSHGNRYIASYSQGEIRVFNAKGDSIGRLALRTVNGMGAFDNRSGNAGNVDNCVFGGPDLKTLYITGDGGLYSIQLKIAGRSRYTTTAISRFQLRPVNKTRAGIFIDAKGRKIAWTNHRRNIPVLPGH